MDDLSFIGRRVAIAPTALGVVLVLATMALPCLAATLRVPGEYPTIQSAIEAASIDDTVLVAQGTYAEAIGWANKDLVLLGDGTPDSIVVTTHSTDRVVALGPGITGATVLRNLSFREGAAEEGAGMKLVDASPVLQLCRFELNVASREPDYPKGGAMFVDRESRPVIADCFFGQNRAEAPWPYVWPSGLGAAIFVEPQGTLAARRCVFQENVAWGFEGGAGGGIFVVASASAQIDSCAFLNNFGYGGGVYSTGDVVIRRCTFSGNHGYTGAALYFPDGGYVIEGSVFNDNEVWGIEGGAIDVHPPGEIIGNSVAFNIGLQGYAGITAYQATMTRNIVCLNQGWGVGCVGQPQSFACNDVWGNVLDGVPANYECTDLTGTNGNISADPLFCAPESRELSLHADSPCVAGPDTCGLIGALGVGCGLSGIGARDSAPLRTHFGIRPNPVRSSGVFSFDASASPPAIEIYDPNGRLIDLLQPLGRSTTWLPGSAARSGVYFARLRGAGGVQVVKFLVLR